MNSRNGQTSYLISPSSIVTKAAIGDGTYATVAKGTYTQGDGATLSVAIKTPKSVGIKDAIVERQIFQMINDAAVTSAHNILTCYGYIETDNSLVLELMPTDLEKWLILGNCNEEHKHLYLRQIAAAIDLLHRKFDLIHRDVKPANVLIDPAKVVAKLADLSFAVKKTADKILARGTIMYLAPEIIYKFAEQPGIFKISAFEAIDIWAFGVTMLESMLNGQLPFGLNPNDDRWVLTRKMSENEDFSHFIPPEVACSQLKLAALAIWSCEKDKNKRPTAEQLHHQLALGMNTISPELSLFAPPSAANRQLYQAVRKSSLAEMSAAFEAGADANYKPRYGEPCFSTAMNLTLADINVFNLFVNNGVNLAAHPSVMMAVIRTDNDVILKRLLDGGISTDFMDSFGMSTLQCAIEYNADKCFALLLTRKANPNMDPDFTALDDAIISGKIRYIRPLLEASATYAKESVELRIKNFGPEVKDEIREILRQFNGCVMRV